MVQELAEDFVTTFFLQTYFKIIHVKYIKKLHTIEKIQKPKTQVVFDVPVKRHLQHIISFWQSLSYLTHNKGEKGQKMNMHKNNKMYE